MVRYKLGGRGELIPKLAIGPNGDVQADHRVSPLVSSPLLAILLLVLLQLLHCSSLLCSDSLLYCPPPFLLLLPLIFAHPSYPITTPPREAPSTHPLTIAEAL